MSIIIVASVCFLATAPYPDYRGKCLDEHQIMTEKAFSSISECEREGVEIAVSASMQKYLRQVGAFIRQRCVEEGRE